MTNFSPFTASGDTLAASPVTALLLSAAGSAHADSNNNPVKAVIKMPARIIHFPPVGQDVPSRFNAFPTLNLLHRWGYLVFGNSNMCCCRQQTVCLALRLILFLPYTTNKFVQACVPASWPFLKNSVKSRKTPAVNSPPIRDILKKWSTGTTRGLKA